MGVKETDPLAQLSLPPGFRFYPTDEELLVEYLCKKVAGHHFSLQIIGEIDLYKFDPWILPSKAMFGEKEWYFFSPRDRKYPNGSRPNRVAGSGYWKATGTDKIITTEGRKVGIKKALVFYIGKAPKGIKTNWIMHEYRLLDSSRQSGSSKLDDWVLCRIYEKNSGGQKPIPSLSSKEHSTNNSSSSCSSQTHLDDALDTFPEMEDRLFSLPRGDSLKIMQQDDKNNLFNNLAYGNFDWTGFNSVSELVPNASTQAQTQGLLGYASNAINTYISSVPQLSHVQSSMEEEVQSGLPTQRPNSGVLTQNFNNSVDPYGLRYPAQMGSRFGFRL